MWCSTGWAGWRSGRITNSLASTGHWISYGHATGALPPLDPGLQSAKSLRLSRPVLFHYTDDPVRLRAMAANVFAMLERGVLKVTCATVSPCRPPPPPSTLSNPARPSAPSSSSPRHDGRLLPR